MIAPPKGRCLHCGFNIDEYDMINRYLDNSVPKELYEMIASDLSAAQAKIDALMLEYCPDEMTEAQRDEWERHQKPAPSGFDSGIVIYDDREKPEAGKK